MSTAPVPIHPEATEAADVLRWVFPAGTLGFVGEPVRVPDSLQDLYVAGVLTGSPVVQPEAVFLRIGDGHSWRADGPEVRRALQAALARPGEWQPPVDSSEDHVLRAAVEEILAGAVGDFVRGHGGVIEVLDVADHQVTVELGGACAGCPASGTTVQSRFETALRQRYPRLRAVVAHQAPRSRRSRLIQLLPTRF
jgi:Fe/S biogenesis protein NfuA